MRYLLDTHTFLWFINADDNLSIFAKEQIVDSDNHIFISIASFWEIAIKVNLEKLRLETSFDEIEKYLEANNIQILPITFRHTQQLLPLPQHHKDPFDRMMIAQAMTENISIITKDESFLKYDVKIVW